MATFHRLKYSVGIKVLDKFNHSCTICGATSDLCVHHIIKMSPDNPHYNEESNLTVLCRSCHMKLHRAQRDIEPPLNTIYAKGVCHNPNGRRGNTPPVVCKVDGCKELQHARGLCKKHYEYKRRHGILYRPINGL